MKTIFTLLLITLFSTAYSQFSVGMHIGASNKNVIVGLHSQYEFANRFTIGLNMTTHTDNSNPAFFQSRFGYTMGNNEGFSVQPYIGYSYSIQNVEKGNYGGQFAKGVQLRYQMTNIASVYADINAPGKGFCLFSIGIAGRF